MKRTFKDEINQSLEFSPKERPSSSEVFEYEQKGKHSVQQLHASNMKRSFKDEIHQSLEFSPKERPSSSETFEYEQKGKHSVQLHISNMKQPNDNDAQCDTERFNNHDTFENEQKDKHSVEKSELKSNENKTGIQNKAEWFDRSNIENNDRSPYSAKRLTDKRNKSPQELTPVESQASVQINPEGRNSATRDGNSNQELRTVEDQANINGNSGNLPLSKIRKELQHSLDNWKTEKPLALLSIVGEADGYLPTATIKEHLKNAFEEMIKTTDIWIFIPKQNTGVVNLVKEVIRRNVGTRKCRVFHKDTEYTFTCDQTYLQKKTKNTQMESFSFQEPNDLEYCFKEYLKIPLLLIIVGGERSSFEIAMRYLMDNVPVVVIEGSGGAADFIVKGYKMSMQTKREDSSIFPDTFKSVMIEEAKNIWSYHDTLETDESFIHEEVTAKLQLGLETKRKYMHVQSVNDVKTTLDKNIQNIIFKSFYHDMEDNKTVRFKNKILHYVDLWNRPDIAKTEVFNLDSRKVLQTLQNTLSEPKSRLAELFANALVKNRVDFVRLVLEYIQNKALYKMFLETYLEELYTYARCRAGLLVVKQTLDTKKTIVEKINKTVAEILEDKAVKPFTNDDAKIGIQEEDSFKHLFIWAVLMNRKELAMLFWNKQEQDYIFSALYASSLSKKLAQNASEESYADEQAALVDNASYYEDLAYSVMTQLYLTERKQARELLVSAVKRYNNTTIFEITEKYTLMKFMGHAACQTQLNKIWKGRILSTTSNLKVFAAAFIPFLIMGIVRIDSAEVKKEKCKLHIPKWMTKIFFFYHSPAVKFLFSVLTYMALLLIFSLFILTDLYPVSEKGPSIKEYIVYTWAASTLIEEMRQAFVIKQVSFSLMTWFSFWTLFEIVMYSMLTASVVLRFTLSAEIFYHARMAYAITLGIFIINSMQFFLVSKHIGPKVIMIGRMMFDIVFFLLIFAVFLFGFGVIYRSTMYPNSTPGFQLFKEIIYMPYWQLYGELFLDQFEGKEPSTCTDDVTLYRNGTIDRCPEINQMNTVVLGVYMVVTHIILVNILIAMFSHTFTTVQDNNEQVWKFHRFSLIQEYYDRSPLVPPIIIFTHLKRALTTIYGKCKYEDKTHDKFKIKRDSDTLTELAILEESAVRKYHIQNMESDLSGLKTSNEDDTDLPVKDRLILFASKLDTIEKKVFKSKRKRKNTPV